MIGPLVAFTSWPLWGQILASIGVALVWLTFLNWAVGFFKKPKTTHDLASDQSKKAGAHTAGDDAPAAAVVGDNAKIDQRIYNFPPQPATPMLRPNPVLLLRPEKDALFLNVRNDGEAATFAAEIRFLAIKNPVSRGKKPWVGQPFNPSWSSGFANSVIARGGTESIVLAMRIPFGRIRFPYTTKDSWGYRFEVGRKLLTSPLQHASVRLEITVTSIPSPNGPVPRLIFTTDENFNITAEERPTL